MSGQMEGQTELNKEFNVPAFFQKAGDKKVLNFQSEISFFTDNSGPQ